MFAERGWPTRSMGMDSDSEIGLKFLFFRAEILTLKG